MNSKNKKNFAYQMRQKQEKIRNKFMKEGVTLVAPETIFFIIKHKIWKKCCYQSLCCNWFKGKNWK